MILEALKSKTEASHRQLEASPLLQPISDRTLTPEKYTRILCKFYGFFQPLEIKIEQMPLLGHYIPDLASRRKASSLLQDMELVTGASVNANNIPRCPYLPQITNLSKAFGALYVLEGSTLGGKFISKIILETLGFTPENGTAFFSGYGADTGMRWKTFQAALVQYTPHSQHDDAVVAAATDTFQKLDKWFNL